MAGVDRGRIDQIEGRLKRAHFSIDFGNGGCESAACTDRRLQRLADGTGTLCSDCVGKHGG